MSPDWKPGRRIVDKGAWRKAVLREPECVICEQPTDSSHHLLKRSQGGDDLAANLVGLCGDGVRGCHGRIEAEDPVVRRLLGEYVRAKRPDFMQYLPVKLGSQEAADAWLERRLLV